jgi:hypothetical protein
MRVETLLEKLFFTTVFIECIQPDGSTATGTGFIYAVDTGPNERAQFLVTNKHVIEDSTSATIRFIAGHDPEMTRPALGVTHTVNVHEVETVFTGHPDPAIDVAIAPITPWLTLLEQQGHHVFLRSINPALAMSESDGELLDAVEPITFVGYPNGLYDEVNFLPIARRGFTATPPMVDYGGEPVFLIDASVFPGSSGSPVLVADAGAFSIRGGGVQLGNRTIFLGILAAAHQRAVPILQRIAAAGSFVYDGIDIGVVYKARAIDETVDLVFEHHGVERYVEQTDEPISQTSTKADALSGGTADAERR